MDLHPVTPDKPAYRADLNESAEAVRAGLRVLGEGEG